jgi:hypothetical protein
MSYDKSYKLALGSSDVRLKWKKYFDEKLHLLRGHVSSLLNKSLPRRLGGHFSPVICKLSVTLFSSVCCNKHTEPRQRCFLLFTKDIKKKQIVAWFPSVLSATYVGHQEWCTWHSKTPWESLPKIWFATGGGF